MWSPENFVDKRWTGVTLYSTNGLLWSPENLVDRRDFLQYKCLEVVTRGVGGQALDRRDFVRYKCLEVVTRGVDGQA